MENDRKALVLGATGLVGGHLLRILSEDKTYSTITCLLRSKKNFGYDKVKEAVVDFSGLENYRELFNVDDVFCCLGTTMKKAGSKEAFRMVDYEYPLAAANIAKRNGAQRFFIITALGAKSSSSVFYNRVKGEVETDIEKLSFSALHIFRPSLLLGEREEKRFREDIGIILYRLLTFLFVGPLRKFRAIRGEAVAQSMAFAAASKGEGVFIHESAAMQKVVNSRKTSP